MKYLALATIGLALWLPGCAPSRESLRNDAVTKFDLGKYDESQQTLKRLLDHYPGDYEAFYWLGRVNFAQGQYAQATFNFRQSLDSAPWFTPSRKWLARAQEQSGISRAEQFDFVP